MISVDRSGGRRFDGLITVGAAAVCVGAAIASSFVGFYPAIQIADAAVGLAFAAVGVISRRRDRTISWLAFATSLTWFAASFFPIALYWHRGPLLHLMLRGGRDRTRWRYRSAVGIVYAVSIYPAIWGNDAVAAILALAFLVLVVLQRGSASSRAMAAIFAAVIVGHTLANALAPAGQGIALSLLVYDIALIAVAALTAIPLLGAPARVTDLIVDLQGSRAELLRDELAAAIGDRTIRIGEWDAGARCYSTADGTEIDTVDPPAGRATTVIDLDGRRAIAIEHTPGSLDDPALRDAVSVAARVTARNSELRARNAERIAELEASRRRLVTASDRARMQLGADVERIVLSDLSALAEAATLDALVVSPSTAARLDDAGVRIAAVGASIQDTLAGLAPRDLSQGVMAAIRASVQDSPRPVGVNGEIARMPSAVELALVLASLEAVTNAVKHSGASSITVHAHAAEGHVQLTVADDGRGGAETSGWGLSGIFDRIAAIGGTVHIDSPPAGGTTIQIAVPLSPTG